MTAPRLTCTQICKSFPPTTVLDHTQLTLQAGEVSAIYGASGTGKSTLLNILGLLEQPDSGTLVLDGTELTTRTPTERAHIRATQIGFVFQGFHLMSEFSVLENILMPARCAGIHNKKVLQDARDLLQRVGLAGKEKGSVLTLSGGERQRVAICRALLLQPSLILADEPTGNLDPATGATIMELFLELTQQSGSSVLIVTHDQDIAQYAQQSYQLRDGKLHQ